MIFVYKKWDEFCKKLSENGIYSIPSKDVNKDTKGYIVLKHDVEDDVKRALELAKIEHKYGHKGSYYVQAYLMNNEKNIKMLQEMQMMGHEISYHYDVMDSCKGDLEKAIEEFEKNKSLFEDNGFEILTVCQHGNPVVERVGYTSNRDFFRSPRVQELYPSISDIMVNFKEQHETEYLYYSDAGRQFKLIFDPINNDVENSDDKNIAYKDLEELYSNLDFDGGVIISTHPHRWTKSKLKYIIKLAFFKVAKFIAKILIKIPFMKKFMSRFYHLAKKI